MSYKGVTKTGNVGGVAGGGAGVPPAGTTGGGGTAATDGGDDDAGVDAGLGAGFSCIPSGAYNGGCASGLACELYESTAYTCQSVSGYECDGGCLAQGQLCDPSVSPNGGCLPAFDCVLNLSSGSYSSCQLPDAGS